MDEYGARVERGKVVGVESGGARVASLSRDGITSPPLRPIPQDPPLELAAGQLVYFFLFDDGLGLILGLIETGV